MVYMYTGTPGTGKSLHAVVDIYNALKYGSKKLVITNFTINTDVIKKQKNEILVIPNTHLTVARLQKEAINFFVENYNGKIKEEKILLFLDEAGQLFNSRNYQTSGRSDWCTFFSEHRKYGFDIYLICQFDRQIDRQIRAQVQYQFEHRKTGNFGKIGKLLSFVLLGKQFFYVIRDYPTGERLGKNFSGIKKKHKQMYNTFEVFDLSVQNKLLQLAAAEAKSKKKKDIKQKRKLLKYIRKKIRIVLFIIHAKVKQLREKKKREDIYNG